MTLVKKQSTATRKKHFLNEYGSSYDITEAILVSGIKKTTYYNWLKTDIKFKEQIDTLDENMTEYAENKLKELIKEGDLPALKYFLDRQDKKKLQDKIDNALSF